MSSGYQMDGFEGWKNQKDRESRQSARRPRFQTTDVSMQLYPLVGAWTCDPQFASATLVPAVGTARLWRIVAQKVGTVTFIHWRLNTGGSGAGTFHASVYDRDGVLLGRASTPDLGPGAHRRPVGTPFDIYAGQELYVVLHQIGGSAVGQLIGAPSSTMLNVTLGGAGQAPLRAGQKVTSPLEDAIDISTFAAASGVTPCVMLELSTADIVYEP